MNCGDLKNKLQEYMDGTLSPVERKRIDEHLGSCLNCAESFADLQKTVRSLKNLPGVEPPPWLTQKVMARIKEEKAKAGLLRRLFYPLHIKLPVEAAATVLIAVTAFYVFKTIQPEMKVAEAPSNGAAPQFYSQEMDTSRTKQEIEKVPPADAPSDKKRGPAISPPAKAGETGFAKEIKPAEQPMPEKALEQKEIPGAPAPAKKFDEAAPSAGAVAREEMKQEADRTEPGKTALAFRQMPDKTIESIEQKAVAAAEDWLPLVDGKHYAESWESAAAYFRNAVTKEQWDRSLLSFRDPLGKVIKRKILSKQYTITLSGAPDGEYVVIQYETSFENKKSAIETVTPMLEKDGAWRVSGYYIK